MTGDPLHHREAIVLEQLWPAGESTSRGPGFRGRHSAMAGLAAEFAMALASSPGEIDPAMPWQLC